MTLSIRLRLAFTAALMLLLLVLAAVFQSGAAAL